jgi:kynurenine formamidase
MTADVRFSGRNWGRWGEDDERGALNLVTPQRVLEAARQVKRGSVYELGRPIDHRMPVPQSRSVPVHSMTRDATARGRRANFADDTILLATHTGAHIDALAHVWYDGMLYNGFSDQSVATDGVRRCGIEKIGPLVGRGVLADIRGGSSKGLAPEERITRDRLQSCLADQGTAVREGDVVLVRTGWWPSDESGAVDFDREPGLDIGAARWLAECDVAAVGADNFALEVLPSGGPRAFPVHELLLRDCGISILEGLALDDLAAARVYEFLFVCAPLSIVGGTASPVTPLAIA